MKDVREEGGVGREGVREEVKDVREEGGVGREGVREEVKDVREGGGVGREGVREEVSRHCKSSEMVSLAAHFVFMTALSDQTNSACVWLKLLFCQFNWLCTNNWSK